MAEPLTAEYRLDFGIEVPTLVHKLRFYCEASPSVLSSDGYYLFDRLGIAALEPSDCAQSLWTALRPWFHTDTPAPSWTLFNRSGVVWNPVASGALTGAGTVSTGSIVASQFTISLVTDTYKRIRIILLEQALFGGAQKVFGYAGLHGPAPLLAEAITGVDADGNGFFQWARNKSKHILNGGAAIVSGTWDLNDKVRRARGVQ